MIVHDDKTIICQVCEDLKNDLFVIGMKDYLKNQKSNSKSFKYHDKFKFQNGLLYHDGLLYAPNGPTWHQTWWFNYIPFWIQQNHGVNILKLRLTTTLEVCEKNYWIMWCLCLSKKIFIITFMDSFNHCQSLHCHHFQSICTSLIIFHSLIHATPFWWWWNDWWRWFISFLVFKQ